MASATASTTAADPRRRRPRLRTVLLVVNLLILALPLAGVAALRVYENELTRGTEAQLLVQGAFVREAYLEAYERAHGVARPPPPPATALDENRVMAPALDVAHDRVLPPPPAALDPERTPDPLAVAAGLSIGGMLEAATRETLAGIRVVDGAGIVVATSGGEAGRSLANREEVARALGGARASVLRERHSDQPTPPLRSLSRGVRYRVFVALPALDGSGRVVGAVVLSRTPLDLAKALFLHRRPLLLAAAAVLVVVVIVTLLTSFTIDRPARALIARAERVARGERVAVSDLPEPGTREMARLSEAIAAMAGTLERRADATRTLAQHVSHEFKTPLASIRGAVELLRDHGPEMSEAERERFLRILDESTERLERLVRRLLELARAESVEPAGERAAVGEAFARMVGESGTAASRPLAGPVDGGLRVAMASETLDAVLSHLIENARVHGGASVGIRLAARAVDRAVEIEVADDGPGISEANLARVFTPFFTTARDRGGSGLGLSIARALVEAHRGSIALAGPGPGARFVLRLPAA